VEKEGAFHRNIKKEYVLKTLGEGGVKRFVKNGRKMEKRIRLNPRRKKEGQKTLPCEKSWQRKEKTSCNQTFNQKKGIKGGPRVGRKESNCRLRRAAGGRKRVGNRTGLQKRKNQGGGGETEKEG